LSQFTMMEVNPVSVLRQVLTRHHANSHQQYSSSVLLENGKVDTSELGLFPRFITIKYVY
jgi:hypothetical protein